MLKVNESIKYCSTFPNRNPLPVPLILKEFVLNRCRRDETHRVQNGSGTHPASYPMGTRASFPGGKATGAWSSPFTPSRAEVKEYAFMAWCSAKAYGQLYLYKRWNTIFTSSGINTLRLLAMPQPFTVELWSAPYVSYKNKDQRLFQWTTTMFHSIRGFFLSQNWELCHIVWSKFQFLLPKLPLKRCSLVKHFTGLYYTVHSYAAAMCGGHYQI
jgi:hypothetical protein